MAIFCRRSGWFLCLLLGLQGQADGQSPAHAVASDLPPDSAAQESAPKPQDQPTLFPQTPDSIVLVITSETGGDLFLNGYRVDCGLQADQTKSYGLPAISPCEIKKLCVQVKDPHGNWSQKTEDVWWGMGTLCVQVPAQQPSDDAPETEPAKEIETPQGQPVAASPQPATDQSAALIKSLDRLSEALKTSTASTKDATKQIQDSNQRQQKVVDKLEIVAKRLEAASQKNRETLEQLRRASNQNWIHDFVLLEAIQKLSQVAAETATETNEETTEEVEEESTPAENPKRVYQFKDLTPLAAKLVYAELDELALRSIVFDGGELPEHFVFEDATEWTNDDAAVTGTLTLNLFTQSGENDPVALPGAKPLAIPIVFQQAQDRTLQIAFAGPEDAKPIPLKSWITKSVQAVFQQPEDKRLHQSDLINRLWVKGKFSLGRGTARDLENAIEIEVLN